MSICPGCASERKTWMAGTQGSGRGAVLRRLCPAMTESEFSSCPPQARRPLLDGIEQRPVPLLQHVTHGKRRAEFKTKRAQHAIVAVVALQYDANERRGRRTAGGTEFLCDLVALSGIEIGERFFGQTR